MVTSLDDGVMYAPTGQPAFRRLPGWVTLPDYDPEQIVIGQVHLGLGGFHRAHQAAYTDRILAGDPRWGISAYTWSNEDLPVKLTRQNGLYSLLTAQQQPQMRVVGALRSARSVRSSAPRFVQEVASSTTMIVTLTVTEKAYPVDPDTGGLDSRQPSVADDLANHEPRASVVGLLARGLAARAQSAAGGLAVVSCDNLRGNGDITRRLVTDFAAEHPAYRAMGLAAWITEHVTFPSTVVDRIVPSPDDALIARVHDMTGWRDEAPVLAEPYTQWVIQDSFPGPRPPWELAGVVIVDDVEPYEQLKLRVLNATHTALAYPGLLAGLHDVREAISDPVIKGFVDALLATEILPHLPPVDMDVRAYATSVLERFANPELSYSLAKLGADGTQKVRQRLAPTAQAAIATGTVPEHVAAVVAAWVRWIAKCAAEDPTQLADPHRAALLDAAMAASRDGAVDPGCLATRIFDTGLALPADLAGHAGFRSAVVSQALGSTS